MRLRVLTGLKRCRRCRSTFPVVWVEGAPLNVVGDEVQRAFKVGSLTLRDGPNGMGWMNVCPVCGTDHRDDYLRADNARGELDDVNVEEVDLDVRCVLCGGPLERIVTPDHAVCESCIGDLRYVDPRSLDIGSRRSTVRRLRDVRREMEHGDSGPEDIVDSAIAAELRAIRSIEDRMRSSSRTGDRTIVVAGGEVAEEYADVFEYVDEMRDSHPRTLFDWTPSEARRLSSMRAEGMDARAIGDLLERVPGEVRHRMSTMDGSEKVPRGPPVCIGPSAKDVPSERAYEPWTGEEEERLLSMVADDVDERTIAVAIGRSPSAIRSRLRRLNG